MSLHVDIRKQYRGFALDMKFESGGSMLGILGASGSGKSLTLKCIAGIETPDEGRIVANGRVLFDSDKRINLKPQQRKVGYLFQSYALFPHMTVAQNIACVLQGNRRQKKEQIDALLQRFEMDALSGRYPAQLSGGQQQRAALVRILAYEPEVLLLDEPFSALDAYMREKMQIEVKELLEGEYAGDTIMVTHSRDEVYRLCESLLVLDEGHTLVVDDTKKLFADPCILQAARLTGCKNLSRAAKTGERSVRALDWGVEFEVAKDVGENITHIGIRAHDFRPASGGAINSIRIRQKSRMETPFEWSMLFQNADEGETAHEIWWISGKQAGGFAAPEYLAVNPSDILLLEEKQQ